MVDTIKFSQMPNAGNINNNDIMPSLRSGANVILNNPWTFLPSGTTADRPTPSSTVNYRLRYNTTDDVYEYYNAVVAAWVQLSQNTTVAGPFVTYTADVNLPGAQNLGALANGILKQTITLGVATLAIAVNGTDYYGPGSTPTFAGMTLTGNLDMGGFTAFNAADPIQPQDYATKKYVDQTALNGTSVYAASAALLGTVTQAGSGVGATLTNAGSQAVFALDGVNPPVGSNVLIKNTATGMTAANEGIYTVTDAGSVSTNWVLTRATSYDTPTEINNTGLILVSNGSTLAGTAWYNSTPIVTVDATNFNYNQFGNIIFPVSLANGGTSASLTASNGGIFYSTASAGAILSGTATARQMLQSGSSAAPAWSTATWPATTTINQLLYSSSANTVVGLATVNSAGLLTSAGGVPGWVAYTGTGAPVLNTSPRIITSILDTNGNTLIGINPSASSVNYLQVQNAATGNRPSLAATSLTDTNVSGYLFAQGTGGWGIQGATNGNAQGAGYVGEILSAQVVEGSAVSMAANTLTNILSLSLTAGNWMVFGNINVNPAGAAAGEAIQLGVNSTSATLPITALVTRIFSPATISNGVGGPLPIRTFNFSSTTTIYGVGISSRASGSSVGYGTLVAIRLP